MTIVLGLVFDHWEMEEMDLIDNLSTQNACLGSLDGVSNWRANVIVLLILTWVFYHSVILFKLLFVIRAIS